MMRRSTSWSSFRSGGAPSSVSTRMRPSPECSILENQVVPLKSCLSVGNFAQLSESSPSSRTKKSVNFHKIEIREHPRALGDNPSVSAGPALSLGWYSEEEGHSSLELPVDDYEAARPKRREKHELMVPKALRTQLLREHAGVSRSEMAAAQRETNKIKQSRRLSNSQRGGGGGLTFVLERVGERMRRSASDRQVKELMERAERAEKIRKQYLAATSHKQTVELEQSECKQFPAFVSTNNDEAASKVKEESSDTASEDDDEGALAF